MLNDNLKTIGTRLAQLASHSNPVAKMITTLDIVRFAMDPASHEGLTIMVREASEGQPPELVVFETEGERGALRYGGIGGPEKVNLIGSDGPATFIVGLCMAAKALKVPFPEVVEMIDTLAKAVHSGYHEAKGDGR